MVLQTLAFKAIITIMLCIIILLMMAENNPYYGKSKEVACVEYTYAQLFALLDVAKKAVIYARVPSYGEGQLCSADQFRHERNERRDRFHMALDNSSNLFGFYDEAAEIILNARNDFRNAIRMPDMDWLEEILKVNQYEDEKHRLPVGLVLAIGFAIWSIPTNIWTPTLLAVSVGTFIYYKNHCD